MTKRLFFLALCLPLVSLRAEPLPQPLPVKPQPVAPASETFKEVSPGVLQLGLVTLEPKQRLIKIPAVVTVQDGVVKYVLVGQEGKTSESILATKADPLHLHLAMLSLGFKEQVPGTASLPKTDPSIAGVPLHVTLHWVADGKEKQAPAENWIWNNKTQEPMAAGDWLYNNSKTTAGIFISLIPDSQALMNPATTPRLENESESIWKSRSDTVPPVGTAIEIHIQWPETQTANVPPQPSETLSPAPSSTPPSPTPAPLNP